VTRGGKRGGSGRWATRHSEGGARVGGEASGRRKEGRSGGGIAAARHGTALGHVGEEARQAAAWGDETASAERRKSQ